LGCLGRRQNGTPLSSLLLLCVERLTPISKQICIRRERIEGSLFSFSLSLFALKDSPHLQTNLYSPERKEGERVCPLSSLF
jgi:hypothetical protein